ncbi:DNA mismatch repair protein [Prevotella sp. P4-51]|uniref:ATP-binding protein n=1 Tax=Prevotella sp. P4-51 TaxID=2024228 RepID=UPI000B96389B|nr:ATP-binding protein [Prevotella sp. P4-51]OYP78956.1 DNA mismatch repair protein [Prevotella sp. P4-51]
MKEYNFNISLSILNHLGRNLYRSFITVLGEAVSNSWDADAQNVYITIDREEKELIVRDDGLGMNEDDFQNKFLKIGYSKRKDNMSHTKSGRPFIGRKGIGKLALLSCAQTITVLTKNEDSDIVGGVIDNSGLDDAIKDDKNSTDYKLGIPEEQTIRKYSAILGSRGTLIIFNGIKDGIRNRIDYIRKLVALYFRFSLKDSSFNIFINDEIITLDELSQIKGKTQFAWIINGIDDPYINDGAFKKKKKISIDNQQIKGFIASVETPSDLKIRGTDEKISIDLYVNGRLREKDVLRHIPTARIVESYLYGQIHFDELDDENDRFTSSREGVVPDDPKFNSFLKELEGLLKTVINDWDIWRSEINQDGDSENPRLTKKQRKSQEFFNVVVEDFKPSKDNKESRKKVDSWLNELRDDAEFNFASYGECFLSENLLRKYIQEKGIPFPDDWEKRLGDWKKRAEEAKNKANISIDIREDDSDLSYCSMDDLAFLVEGKEGKGKNNTLFKDACEYKPIRDALAHTSRLTRVAKNKLNTTYENIKARIVGLLNMA